MQVSLNKPWHDMTREQANELYAEVLAAKDVKAMVELCLYDLFFLLTVALRRLDMDRDWLYERCREVEKDPDGYLDLWAREHYKSTIITFGLTIQDILRDSSVTIGIFSHTRPIAKAFLKQIKTELENNTYLKNLFPEVLYQNPEKESPSWSLDGGITVKRKSNPKENTVEAWGLVDGQPTSKHFGILIYDDVVTRESISTPDQILKTTDAWALSLSLGSAGGRVRYIGTYYHFADTWHEMEKRLAAKVRKHPATKDGTADGEPVLITREALARKRREMGVYVFSCQMLLNPVADNVQGFKDEGLRYYDGQIEFNGMNLYLLADPANAKKKYSDYTAMVVIGLAPDNNYYLVHAVRDRMDLMQRTNMLFALHRRFRLQGVGYENYGMQADIGHIQYVQAQRNYRFGIKELGGSMPKSDRIKRLMPVFEAGRFWMPRRLIFRDTEGKTHDFIQEFIDDEFRTFPVGAHDDCLDTIARILDPDFGAVFPALQSGDWAHSGYEEDELPSQKAFVTRHKYDVLAGVKR